MGPKILAEFIGTFWLVLGGCGSAVLAAAFPSVGIGLARRFAGLRPDRADRRICARADLGRPLQPGGLGRSVGGRPLSGQPSCLPYVVAQVVGAVVGAGVLYLIASGKADFESGCRLRLQRLRRRIRPASIR